MDTNIVWIKKTSHLIYGDASRESCNARCKTDVNDLMIIDNQRMDHSHEPEQERTLQRQKLRQECKKRVLEETTERPKKVIITKLGKKEKTETDKLPGMGSIT
jgi:hypothetical protein